MIKLHTQQGDCLLELVTTVPKTAKQIKLDGNLIVLRGEGVNTHTIEDVSGVEAYEQDGVMYLKTSKPVKLVHAEHGTTTLEPNKIYKRVIEREWDYFAEESRQTRD